MDWLILAVLGVTLVLFVIIEIIGKNKRPFKKAVFSIFLGILALAVVNISGMFTGVSLPISTLSVSTAAAGGIPGVTLMLVLQMFFCI